MKKYEYKRLSKELLERSKVNIDRNDLCLCGSGKKYKNWHIDSNYFFGEIGTFYDGKVGYENFGLHDTLLHEMLIIQDDIYNVNRISIEEGLKLLERLFSVLDPALEQLQINAPCKKSCSACCYQPVNLTQLEVTNIENKLSKSINENIKKT